MMSTILLLTGIAIAAGVFTLALNKTDTIANDNKDWNQRTYLFYNRGRHVCKLTFVEGVEAGERGETNAGIGARISRIHKDGVRETYIKRRNDLWIPFG
jgi:hypothetical protein